MATTDTAIKNWMNTQTDLSDFFTNGIIDPDWAEYTNLGQLASAELGFEEGSAADDICFEMAVEVLDAYAG